MKMNKLLGIGAVFLLLHAPGLINNCWAQDDSTKVNTLSFSMNLMTHGEACGGGLPRRGNSQEMVEDHSRFLFGRLRLNVDYDRKWVQFSKDVSLSAGYTQMMGTETMDRLKSD